MVCRGRRGQSWNRCRGLHTGFLEKDVPYTEHEWSTCRASNGLSDSASRSLFLELGENSLSPFPLVPYPLYLSWDLEGEREGIQGLRRFFVPRPLAILARCSRHAYGAAPANAILCRARPNSSSGSTKL